ncbi:MAG: hypothetical protein AAF721_36795 [Myxococcota bacterium]
MVRALVVLSLFGAPERPAPSDPPTPDAEWEPADAPPPTPWAQAGARGWRLCHDAEEQARAAKRGGPRGGSPPDEVLWTRRAEQCPHAPYVLSVAAESEIVQGAELLSGVENWDREGQQVGDVATQHAEKISRALGWLQASIEESARRGVPPPRETYYYRAYALTTLGRFAEAEKAVALAAKHHDAATHRIQRMAAVIKLFTGDLTAALRLGHRAVIDAPADADRLISRFIYALVLDRAGALHSASTEFTALQREGGRYGARLAVESLLPVHERLFLRALDHQANDRQSHAIRVWEMYLGRDEPEPAERVLAERHRAELEPRPELTGGPKQ